MANYNNLKTAISEVIKTNGNEKITGALLQQSLLAMINALGAGYQFVGIAQPDTLPGAVDYRCFYIAAKAGTYTYFNDIEVEDGELVLLVWDTDWTKQSIVLGVADGAVTETKIADGSITGDKFSVGLKLYINKQFSYLNQVQVKYGEDPSVAIKSFAQRDNKTALYIKLTNGLLVPANTNGETASGLYSYGNTVRKVLFDGTNWSDIEIQNDIIDTAHIKDGAVTSSKLAMGARRPIILTPSTTEVDEETYQKLLSDDVDVVFKAVDGEFCVLTYKVDADTTWDFYFSCFSVEGETEEDTYIYAYQVSIVKNAPHTCTISMLKEAQSLKDLITAYDYINKATLSPILKEIDLTGTDAERKAKLDKFETDWKALTGASDLRGARFVGRIEYGRYVFLCLLCYSSGRDFYSGIAVCSDNSYDHLSVFVDLDGNLRLIPLFSHLEAITIKIGNTATDKADNKAAIQAYVDNLVYLGVDLKKGYTIPIIFTYENYKYSGVVTWDGTAYNGYAKQSNVSYGLNCVTITTEGVLLLQAVLTNGEYGTLTTDSKKIIPAINEINANAVHSDKFVPTLEAITIKTSNSTTDNADNLAAITAYVNNLKALGVDVTKGYMIPVKLDNGYQGFIMGTDAAGEHTGIIKRDQYNYGGGWIQITINGTYQYLEILTTGSYSLTTTSKKIVEAINEINALAMGVKAFGAIELKASDNASNKTAITAYLKILTDAGVSTTNGYSVPVRITGNSQEYHGMLNIGTGVLLSGVVTDVNENHHYPFNVSTTDGAILFDENNYFLEKGSNEVTEMLDAIKYSHTSVPFTDTTLSNKAQLEVFLSKVPNATVMHCTYKEIWAGTLHKINGDWYGLLVKNTNSPADNINVKLSADGTIVTSNSAQ